MVSFVRKESNNWKVRLQKVQNISGLWNGTHKKCCNFSYMHAVCILQVLSTWNLHLEPFGIGPELYFYWFLFVFSQFYTWHFLESVFNYVYPVKSFTNTVSTDIFLKTYKDCCCVAKDYLVKRLKTTIGKEKFRPLHSHLHEETLLFCRVIRHHKSFS